MQNIMFTVTRLDREDSIVSINNNRYYSHNCFKYNHYEQFPSYGK